MEAKLKKAITKLKSANKQYIKLRTKQKPNETDDNALYCDIVGPAWDKYLAAGGSRSMINE